MRQVPLLLVCTALAGCAATGAERFSPGLTVAPVSLMGDHLAVRDVGASALQDYRREEATASTLRITLPAFVAMNRAFSFLALPTDRARAEIETLVEAALRKCLGTFKLA